MSSRVIRVDIASERAIRKRTIEIVSGRMYARLPIRRSARCGLAGSLTSSGSRYCLIAMPSNGTQI